MPGVLLVLVGALLLILAQPVRAAISGVVTTENSDGAVRINFQSDQVAPTLFWAYYSFSSTLESGVQSVATLAVPGQANSYEVNFTVERGNDIYFKIGDGDAVRYLAGVGTRVNDRNPPGTIQGLSVSSQTDSTITLSWSAPGSDGISQGGAVTSYSTHYATGGSAASVNTVAGCDSANTATTASITPVGPGETQTVTFTGLSAGTSYAFCIMAQDQAGNRSPGVATMIATTTADTQAPAVPTAFVIGSVSQSGGQVNVPLSWYTPSDNVAVTSFDLRYKANQAATITDAEFQSATTVPLTLGSYTAGLQQNHTVTGLTPDTWYAFAIKACDAAGNCSAMTSTNIRTPASTTTTTSGLPTGTAGLRVVVRDYNSALVSGAAISLCNQGSSGCQSGNANTAGEYTFSGIAGGSFYLGVSSGPSARTDLGYISNQTVTLVAGTTITQEVTLPRSTATTTGTCATLAAGAVPTGIDGLHVMTSTLPPEIMWSAPNGATGYTIKYSTQNITTANFDSATTVVPSGTLPTACGTSTNMVTLPGLSAGITYYIAVRPYNGNGNGPISNVITLTPTSSGTGTTPGGGGNTLPTGTAVLNAVVRDYNGSLVNNARITLGQSGTGLYATGYSNSSGEYTFPGTVPGTYNVGIDVPTRSDVGYISNQTVTISVGANTQSFTLPRSGTTTPTITPTGGTLPSGTAGLRVVVRDPQGNALSGANLGLCVGANNASPCAGYQTDSTGTYTYTGVAPQSYTLGVGAPSTRSDLMGVGNIVVTLVAGQTATKEVTLTRTSTTPTPTSTSCAPLAAGVVPTGIADLHFMSTTPTVEIMWLVPNGATSYEIRVSAQTITTSGWETYQLISPTVTPTTTCGTSTVSIPLPGLQNGIYYYVAVRARNSAGLGPMSNITGITQGGSIGGTTAGVLPTGTAVFEAIVLDYSGAPVNGARISLGSTSVATLSGSASGYAGSSGQYTFPGTIAGTYSVGIDAPGRSDLGYISNFTVTLTAGRTTTQQFTLPRSGTATPTPLPPPLPPPGSAAILRMVVKDTSGNRVEGATIGLSAGYNGGMSGVTGGDGTYAFLNLAPSYYNIGISPPASRPDLGYITSYPVSVAAGADVTREVTLPIRATPLPVPPGQPVPPPVPVPPPAPPITTQEQCFREAVGEEAYRQIKNGKRKPTPAEFLAGKKCFELILPHPLPEPIPVPGPEPMPMPVPPPIVIGPPMPVPPPIFEDTCEKRELPRMKKALRSVTARFASLEREINKLRRAKVTIPTETEFLLAGAKSALEEVAKAVTCEDAFAAGSELPYLMDQLQDSVNQISRLRFSVSAIKKFSEVATRVIRRAESAIKRLENRKFNAAVLRERLDEVKREVEACKTDLDSARVALDVEGFYERLGICSEMLGKADDIRTLSRATEDAKRFLTRDVENFMRAALQYAKRIEKAGGYTVSPADIRAAVEELKNRRDETLADLKTLLRERDDLLDEMDDVVAAMEALEDLMNRARGIAIYEEFVGKPEAVAGGGVELPKAAADFFAPTESPQ